MSFLSFVRSSLAAQHLLLFLPLSTAIFLVSFSLQGNGSQHFSQLLRRLPFSRWTVFVSLLLSLSPQLLCSLFSFVSRVPLLMKAFPLVLVIKSASALSYSTLLFIFVSRSHLFSFFFLFPCFLFPTSHLVCSIVEVLWRIGLVL